MNSRQTGLDWMQRKGRATDERVVVSKHYTADEAWPRTPVWWFEFAARDAADDPFGFLNMLCGFADGGAEFHHLRVPMGLFVACRKHLGFRSDKFSLYLSAEESRLFREIRGDGQIEFGVFNVDQ